MVIKKNIFIDASNISAGGGITHLTELLNNLNYSDYPINKIIIIAPKNTLSYINNNYNLVKRHYSILEYNYLIRFLWQFFVLPKILNNEKCDLLFLPGGTNLRKFKTQVVMSQNLLPFQSKEYLRYGLSLLTLKFFILRFTQIHTFNNSNGIIYLSKFAMLEVEKKLSNKNNKSIIIPHGIDQRFYFNSRIINSINKFSLQNPFKLIYVSTLEPYKHQMNVIKAIQLLKKEGFPITLDLIGGGATNEKLKIKKYIKKLDKNNEFINYLGLVKHSDLKIHYLNANMSIFASSCETFGQILLESMASSLPIACSSLSVMPEILQNGGVYFDPLNIDSIYITIKNFINSENEMKIKSNIAHNLSLNYSWKKCSRQTFDFIFNFI